MNNKAVRYTYLSKYIKNNKAMGRSHEIDYQIKGESIQIVEVELDPMETVIAEAGAMLFMEDGIQFEAKMGDGSGL